MSSIELSKISAKKKSVKKAEGKTFEIEIAGSLPQELNILILREEK